MLSRPQFYTAIILLVLISMGLMGCESPEAPEKKVRPVLSQLVEKVENWQEYTYSGEILARHMVPLSFRISGKILDRSVDVGDEVHAGTLLAKLDPADYELQLIEAEARLSAVKAEKNKADSDLVRYRELLSKELVSDSLYTDFANKQSVASARLRQAEAELEVTRNQAGYTSLQSDQAGVVTVVEVEKGQVVTAGQTVLRLALEGNKEVMIAVPENRLEELKNADQIRVSLWANPDRSYKGVLREISPGADPITRTYRAKITLLDADAAVQLGMTATVDIRRKINGEVVHLPLNSIYQQDDGSPAVWVINEDGQVDLVSVELGGYTSTDVLIRSGLLSGQRVVTAGVHKLSPGQQVRLTKEE